MCKLEAQTLNLTPNLVWDSVLGTIRGYWGTSGSMGGLLGFGPVERSPIYPRKKGKMLWASCASSSSGFAAARRAGGWQAVWFVKEPF